MREFLIRRFWAIAWCLIALMGLIQVTTIVGETQTWDEGIHLLAGYTYWMRGDYRVNPEHPALAKMLCALPLLFVRPSLPNQKGTEPWDTVLKANEFLYHNWCSPDAMLLAARSVTILLTLVFAFWLAWWTRRRLGPAVALVALTMFVFDPNITAHGRYVTTDLAASFFIFLTATLWVEYLLEPTRRRLILSGLSLGCALTSKYSAVFLIPVMLALFGVRAVWVRVESGSWRPFGWKRFGISAAVLALLSLSFIAAVYAPEVARTPHMAKARSELRQKGALGKALWYIAPRFGLRNYSYVIGLDRISEHDYSGHSSYLLGQQSQTGWWYYFPVAFLVKTPVGTIVLTAGAILLAAVGWRRLAPFGFPIVALAITGGVFALFCLHSHINIGLRHFLPFYALAYVVTAAVWVHAGSVLLLRRVRPFVLAALLVLTAGESLAIYPDYLAFFNFAAGGPANGPKYLLDSNIDWGQDMKKLRKWMTAHSVPYVCIEYFGNADMARYLKAYRGLPEGDPKDVDCYVAISATPLYGLYVGPERFQYWRTQRPIARVGYSIYVFDNRRRHEPQ